jgi:hypothetical protein
VVGGVVVVVVAVGVEVAVAVEGMAKVEGAVKVECNSPETQNSRACPKFRVTAR